VLVCLTSSEKAQSIERGKMRHSHKNVRIWVLTALVMILGLVAFYGCTKAESDKADFAPCQSVDQSVEQTECPVTGGPVNKNIYTVYKCKKVYFCCEGCKKAFERNPKKYLHKLPQFEQ
jgi:YHS domain-containing protein